MSWQPRAGQRQAGAGAGAGSCLPGCSIRHFSFGRNTLDTCNYRIRSRELSAFLVSGIAPSISRPSTSQWPLTTLPPTTRLSRQMQRSDLDSVANGVSLGCSALAVEQYVLIAYTSSNLLYPREDRETSELIYQCRNCNWPMVVGPSCTYRNEVASSISETAGVVTDVASDPTVRHAQLSCLLPT
jgi:hypothetical protein